MAQRLLTRSSAATRPWPILNVQLFSLESFSLCGVETQGHLGTSGWRCGQWRLPLLAGLPRACSAAFQLTFHLPAWGPGVQLLLVLSATPPGFVLPLGLPFPTAHLVKIADCQAHCVPVQRRHRGPLDAVSGALSRSQELERGGQGVDLSEDTAGSLVGIAFCFPSWEWLPSL